MYAYQAALYCDDCARGIIEELTDGLDDEQIEELNSGDTDDFPQWCSDDESDCPNHCDSCNEFLETSLTGYGINYAVEKIAEDILDGRIDSVAVSVWLPFYSLGDDVARYIFDSMETLDIIELIKEKHNL